MKNYNYIQDEIKNMIDARRFTHSLNVVNEAVKLGGVYGVDTLKCRIAALVHDCVKNYSDEDLIIAANNYGIEIDEVQYNFPQLLHGPVAALFSRDKFEIEDIDILNSIYYHTTGRKNMSLLEKIIYLSDVIEIGRYFPGIENIRKLAMVDLDKALIYSCNLTLSYIIEKNFLIHPLTIEFRNSLLLRGGKDNG